MADNGQGGQGGLPIDANLVLHAAATVAHTDSPKTTSAIDVEPGSDGELHIAYTALTSTATLQVDLEARADGSNYNKIARTGVIPATEDAGGETSAGVEEKVHVSLPVYIPKNTQADAYSGSLRRTQCRVVITMGGSGNCTDLHIWLAPRDDGSTMARERLYTAMV